MPLNTNDPYNVNAIGPQFIHQRSTNMPSFNSSIGNQYSYYRGNLTSSYQYIQPNTDEPRSTTSTRFLSYSANQRPVTHADYSDNL